MAYLDNKTQRSYYQGSKYGTYQFCSLEDIINQFVAIYTGEDKIIPRAKRVDVAFHAQRALAELSFDTLKSVKSQQIDLPPSLTMVLPHDYVNYTQLSRVDDSGIKYPLYPTKDTSNPFQVRQLDDGTYDFPESFELVTNGDFSSTLEQPWFKNFTVGTSMAAFTDYGSDIKIANGALNFVDFGHNSHGGTIHGLAFSAWQELDVRETEYIDLEANGVSVAAVSTGTIQHTGSNLRVGISTGPGDQSSIVVGEFTPQYSHLTSYNYNVDLFDLQTSEVNAKPSYLEWSNGESGDKELLGIDVSNVDTVYIVVTCHTPFTTGLTTAQADAAATIDLTTNTVDNISVKNSYPSDSLQPAVGKILTSSTWDNYKSTTSAETRRDDFNYDDDNYDLNKGQRYGIHPQNAQVNGSFYIDESRGRIHFSSNVSGKTVILDYISDSLGTEAEMQVHKLAEDAMYKYILHEMLSGRSNVGAGQLLYHRKNKIAAVRKAKLRLSNFKLKELTQVLRGKSKWIKH